MAVQIQIRRDTAAAWITANPTLAQGELGIETDTRLAKLGDGVTAWNALAYWPAPSGGVLLKTTAQRIAMPPSTTAGTLVYDTDMLKLFVWQADIDYPVWLEV